MEDFPANSRTPKPSKPAKEAAPKPEDKKVEKVVVGEVGRRKKPLGRKFKDLFLGGESKGVVHYIFFDVLIPAAKDAVAEAVTQGIERMLFGESRGPRRTANRTTTPSSPYTSYNRPNTVPWRQEEQRREVSHRARTLHDFDEITLATRAEADNVLDHLFTLVQQYGQATVGDLYELVGISSNFTDDKWGWTQLQGAGIDRIRGAYLLRLPQPELLD